MIIGVDEAGRGPVTGPLVIGAVGIREKDLSKIAALGVKDSKMLTPKERGELEKEIAETADEYHTVIVPAYEIDAKRKVMSLNEIEAIKMAEIIEKFSKKPKQVIIDLPDPTADGFVRRIMKYMKVDFDIKAEHKADQNYPIVSAASIIAKEERDRQVRKIEQEYNIILGTGYSHDERAIKTIENYFKNGEKPDFIRYSWLTARRIMDKKYQKKLEEF